jgi:sulfate adenylyltransferase subunit 2
MHVDTGHNFPEVLAYRDAMVEKFQAQLVVASVQEAIDKGRVADPGPLGMRNRLQTTALLDAINDHTFDAAFGGARRDEDKARAKERVLSFRDAFGQWDRATNDRNSGSCTRAR